MVIQIATLLFFLVYNCHEGGGIIRSIYTERIDIRVMPEQKRQIKEKAGDMDLSDYVRRAALEKTIVGSELRDGIRELTNEINKIGVNINQIAKNNNSHLYSIEDKQHLIEDMNTLFELMEQYIGKIKGGDGSGN